MSRLTNVIKLTDTSTKLVYDDKIIYQQGEHTITVKPAEDEVSIKGPHQEFFESKFAEITDQQGQADMEALVDFWVTYGFFFDNETLTATIARATKVTEVGDIAYIGKAAPGSAEASAVWQAMKIDESVAGTTIVEWADGDAKFDNVATDLTTLTYS